MHDEVDEEGVQGKNDETDTGQYAGYEEKVLDFEKSMVAFMEKHQDAIETLVHDGALEYSKTEKLNMYDYLYLRQRYPDSFVRMCNYYCFNYPSVLRICEKFIRDNYFDSLTSGYENTELRVLTEWFMNAFMNHHHFDQAYWEKF
jgi:hypothetical protein